MDRENKRFYFTYGTHSHPFYGGWTVIYAPNMEAAMTLFRMYHPDRVEGVMTCSSIFTEEWFEKSGMANGNFGHFCHEEITVTRTIKD